MVATDKNIMQIASFVTAIALVALPGFAQSTGSSVLTVRVPEEPYVRPEDRDKPKSQSYKGYVDAVIDVM